jgi:hypothetical protein
MKMKTKESEEDGWRREVGELVKRAERNERVAREGKMRMKRAERLLRKAEG